MKKLTVTAILILLALLSVGLASCKPKVPEHEHEWDAGKVVKAGTCDPATKAETKGEIRYTCTICGATKTEETDGHAWNEGDVISTPTCTSTGGRLFRCTRCGDTKTEDIPIDPDAHTLEKNEGRIVTPATALADGEIERVCTKCGKGVSEPLKFADYNPKVVAAKQKVDSFNSSLFGSGTITSNLGGSYALPSVKPTKKQHPRVLFRKGSIDGINAELHDLRSSAASGLFRAAVRKPTDGKLGSGNQNFSEDVMSNIQMLALDYALTKNAISGYNAIYAIKNAITTLSYSGMSDNSRYYGCTMYIAACVYDWCYDLLSDADKQQIVLGVEKKICSQMEIGFPPSGQSALNGHACEYQLLRDYLAFAIAIYDEYPGWWNYIGGRYYEEFVPIRARFYEAGMAPQGVSLYLQTRYASDLYSAWLIYGMTGSTPFNADDMKQVARTIFSHELPGYYHSNVRYYLGFNTGDDHVPDGSFINYGRVALISSHVFGDATMRAELEHFKSSYSDFTTQFTSGGATVAEYLICSSSGLKAASDRHEGMDLILYNGGWLGQTIARNNWGDKQAAVLMKIGVQTTANHDHRDAGQFQIFYREILAGDTGAYVKYGEDHHNYYHKATIAHNSLLIYNPSQSSTDAGYYSGGQNSAISGEISDYSNWLNRTKYVTGEVTGHAEGYADAAKTIPTYAYIAGDIAKAYSSSTVSEVTRRMLAVYDTGNPSVPMYFFVFDNITAKNGSFKKTFLLHVPTEPVISGKTVTVTNGNGKLVLQNVIGNNATIEKIGGADKNFWLNKGGQTNYVQLKSKENPDRTDDFWGRVEISPATGNPTDQLLNVMYVCDADKTLGLTATKIETGDVKGARIGNTAAVFVCDATRRTTAFTFTSGETGTLNYYISGVRAGKWTVSVGGQTTVVTATADGGFLTFSAPAGNVTLTPGN